MFPFDKRMSDRESNARKGIVYTRLHELTIGLWLAGAKCDAVEAIGRFARTAVGHKKSRSPKFAYRAPHASKRFSAPLKAESHDVFTGVCLECSQIDRFLMLFRSFDVPFRFFAAWSIGLGVAP